jgi:hypothetical protein
MKTTKQQLLTLFLLLATVSISLLPIGGAAFGQLQPPTPQERHQELVEQHQRQQQQQPPQSTPAAPTAEEPLFTPAPAPTPATANDGSIKGFFLANNGGVDFSINPDDPGGDGDEERPNYALLASIMSASKPSATDQIRAAETNTDIDVGIIRDAAMESLGDLIFFRTYLAFGDTEAARFH